MEMQELLKFIVEQDDRLVKGSTNASDRERVLARTVKLGEEFGELCDAVLASQGDQRKEKLDAEHDRENLVKEFADVIITTLLLARSLDVDIEEALATKIAKLRERTYGAGR